MNSIKYLALVLFLILIACEDETTNPIGTQVPVDSIEKSSKRGLAFNLTDTSDFGALKSGVSWW